MSKCPSAARERANRLMPYFPTVSLLTGLGGRSPEELVLDVLIVFAIL